MNWSYVELAILIIAILVASPFLFVAFRSARAIAYSKTDDFRLSKAHMWTEPQHIPDGGGSVQLMRLKDGHFVLISVGVSTVKVFTTPDRSDITQCRELREFPMPSVIDRISHNVVEQITHSSQQRHSEDLLVLEHVRRAIGWPESVIDLVSSVESIDFNFLRGVTKHD